MNIIKFKNRRNELLNIFKIIDNNLEKNRSNLESDDYYNYLINYFYTIYSKLNDNNWHNYSDAIFIDKFDKIVDEDELFQCIYQLEYVRLYDTLKDKFINLDVEYIRLMLCILYDFQNLTLYDYKKIISYLSNPYIKNDINLETNFKDKVNKLIDYVDCMKNGYDPITLLFEEETIETLDTGIMTFDKISKYYINQYNNLQSLINNFQNEELVNNIKKIKEIDKKYYNKFIELVRFCDLVSKNLIENLNNISFLVEMFLNFSKIDEVDANELKNLISYKIINNCDIQELEHLYERKKK